MMLKDLETEQKKDINCYVDIDLGYEINEETHCRYEQLKKALEIDDSLVSSIKEKDGRWGRCLGFKCKGTMSLENAERVLEKKDLYYLPIEIEYRNGIFRLINK